MISVGRPHHSPAEENNTAHKIDLSFPFPFESTWTVLKTQHSLQIRAYRFTGSQAHPQLPDSVANCGSGARTVPERPTKEPPTI